MFLYIVFIIVYAVYSVCINVAEFRSNFTRTRLTYELRWPAAFSVFDWSESHLFIPCSIHSFVSDLRLQFVTWAMGNEAVAVDDNERNGSQTPVDSSSLSRVAIDLWTGCNLK